MSTEVDCVNGDTEIGLQKKPSGTDEAQKNDVRTIAATVKSVAATECSPEAATAASACGAVGVAGNQSSGTPSSGSSSRSQKLKKRQSQKTFSSLKDMFNNHQGIGSWADAADVNTPSYSFPARKKSPETEQVSSATQQASASQQGDWNQYPSTDGSQHPPPPGLDRASHSRNVDLANLPDRPPFEVKVANINYKSSDDDLFYFFGGDRNVVNIRSEGQSTRRGIAIVSLLSQSALVHALSLNGAELQGRSLRISLREHQLRAPYSSGNVGPNSNYGHYRNNDSYRHEGGYNTLPHPRRGPPPAPYHGYSSDCRANRLPPQQYPSYRGRDNRRYDYDSRSVRHPRPGNSQFYPRYANRSTDSYGMPPRPPPHNEDQFVHYGPNLEHDDDRRGLGRLRTESVRSSTTDGTEKHERRRLQLQPRTKPLSCTEEDLPVRPTSIFGLAKPVDTYEKERQAEERLRLENEAFKAAEQRSRKSTSEHAASVPVSPVLPLGHISILKPSLTVDREIYPLPIQETFPKVASESVGSIKKARATSVVPQPVTNVEQPPMVSAEAPVSVSTTVTPFPPLPLQPSGPAIVQTARRQSFSNFPEMSDTRSAVTLVRARNSYNRTFTRSRDSVRLQIPLSKQQNIPVRRGKSGLLRGGASSGGTAVNRDKRFAAGREKVEGNIAEPAMPNGEKEPKPEQPLTSKEQKHDSVTTSAVIPAVALAAPSVKQQQLEQQQHPERQQCSKKEKKKQAAAAREMPKYVEPKPFTFSSENKYAALLEADD